MERNILPMDKELALRCKKYNLITEIKGTTSGKPSAGSNLFTIRLFSDPDVSGAGLISEVGRQNTFSQEYKKCFLPDKPV